jgi:hypothetical protein
MAMSHWTAQKAATVPTELSQEPMRELIVSPSSQIELDLHQKHVVDSWETQKEEKKQVGL